MEFKNIWKAIGEFVYDYWTKAVMTLLTLSLGVIKIFCGNSLMIKISVIFIIIIFIIIFIIDLKLQKRMSYLLTDIDQNIKLNLELNNLRNLHHHYN